MVVHRHCYILIKQNMKKLVNSGEDIVFLATDINLPGAVDWVMMQSCFGHNFMLVLEKQEKIDGLQMFYAIVQLIGTRKQAENFIYRTSHPKVTSEQK
nr:hypothetical protein BaRGS_011349 [Batillaria attramentaria]